MPQKHSGNKYRELVFQFQAGAHIFFLAHRFELHGGRFGGAPIGLEAPDHVDAVLGEQLGGHVDDRSVAQSGFEFPVGLAPQGAVFFLRHAFRPTSYDGFGARSRGIGSTFHLRRGFFSVSFVWTSSRNPSGRGMFMSSGTLRIMRYCAIDTKRQQLS